MFFGLIDGAFLAWNIRGFTHGGLKVFVPWHFNFSFDDHVFRYGRDKLHRIVGLWEDTLIGNRRRWRLDSALLLCQLVVPFDDRLFIQSDTAGVFLDESPQVSGWQGGKIAPLDRCQVPRIDPSLLENIFDRQSCIDAGFF